MTLEFFELKQKYERLKESHRKLVSVNQSLEEKLLQNINRYETEKFSLIRTVSSLDTQLEELQRANQRLLAENERFRLDISVATQLLHCRPSNFNSCKLESLPADFQSKAKFYLQQQQDALPNRSQKPERKAKVIRVPISAFPSTTVIYSIPSRDSEEEDDNTSTKSGDTWVPPATMAKVLEERQRELYYKSTPNQMSNGHAGGLHSSRSCSFLGDGLQYIDHGTQTYPNFIGEREKTRQTCIFCQGTSLNNQLLEDTTKKNLTGQQTCLQYSEEPKVFVYTESEILPSSVRINGANGFKGLSNRRKPLASNGRSRIDSTKPIGSMETEI